MKTENKNMEYETFLVELERDNNVRNDVRSDLVTDVLAEIDQRTSQNEKSNKEHSLTLQEIEMCTRIANQIRGAVKVFYASAFTPQQEDDFWNEEIIEQFGIVKKNHIDYIRGLFADQKNEQHDVSKDTDGTYRNDVLNMTIERQKEIIKKMYTVSMLREYVAAMNAGETAIRDFWSTYEKAILTVTDHNVRSEDMEAILLRSHRLFEEAYVNRLLKKAREKMTQQYERIDHENSAVADNFWRQVIDRVRERSVTISDEMIVTHVSQLRMEIERSVTASEKKSDMHGDVRELAKDVRREKIDALKKKVDDAYALYMQKRTQQENAWARIKGFFNVDAQEHADIGFLRTEFERARQDYRAELVRQSVAEGADAYDQETEKMADKSGVDVANFLKRVAAWMHVTGKTAKRSIAAVLLMAGIVGTSPGNITDHHVPQVFSPQAPQERVVSEDRDERQNLRDRILMHDSIEYGKASLVENSDRERIHDDRNIEIVEKTVCVEIDEKGEGVESAIAQYLKKEYADLLKKEGRTAGEAAHRIAQKYAKDHNGVDIDTVWLGSRIIMDYAAKNGDQNGDPVLSDFTIVDINPKKIVSHAVKKTIITPDERDSAQAKEGVEENFSDREHDRDDKRISQGDDRTSLTEGVEDLSHIKHVLQDPRAKTIITHKMRDIFGEAVATGDTPRNFRLMRVAQVFSGDYENLSRKERLEGMITRAQETLGVDVLPSNNLSVGLYMLTLYDIALKKQRAHKGEKIVRKIFG